MSETSFKELHRGYRQHSRKSGEQSFQVIDGESDLWITCARCNPGLPERIASLLLMLRAEIKNAILLDPSFQTSLVPLPDSSPLYHGASVPRAMLEGSRKMNVGPMAAVAGAVAEAVARHFVDECGDIIVENGGDTYLFSSKERTIALLSDPSSQARIGVLVKPEDSPVSFCASSGKFGHSLSFGQGDLAVIRARDGALADAAATAICNMLKSSSDIDNALTKVSSMAHCGLEGAFLQCAGRIGVWGKMELVAL